MKLPKPRKLSSGNWFIQLRLGGESIPVTARTEKECITSARLVKAEYLAGKRESVTDKENPTLLQAIDAYISARQNTLSPSTIRGYEVIKRGRFVDKMDCRIRDISDWQRICNDEAAKCSPKTLKNAWMFIASVLRESGVSPPKVKLPQVVISERAYLEADQIKGFVAAVKGTVCEIPALLALHSLRVSEICALTWEKHIDLKNKRILVSGAIVLDKDNKLVPKKTNKNNASRRYVPIMIDDLYNALEKCEKKEGFITISSPSAINRQINRICKLNGFPSVGVHGLRHSFASLAYHLGMPERVAMMIGGWADASTMQKIYTHLSQKDIAKYERKMSDFYNNANKNANTP